MYDVVIIGSGPAGMSATVYASRAKLNVLLIEKEYSGGGQIVNTQEVDNYLGLPGISGYELGMKFKEHANSFEPDHVNGNVIEINKENDYFNIVTTKGVFQSKTVIIATGAKYKNLGIEGEKEFQGKGISYCATCDAAFFKNKTVAVIGGGDVAVGDAIVLSKFCKKVYLIHRRNSLRATKILQEKMLSLENVEVIWNTSVTKINGGDIITSINIETEGKFNNLLLNGVFIAIGMEPNTKEFKDLIELDKNGYIIANETGKTNMEGIFAAGDVRTKELRQVVTSVSDGANAVASVERFLSIN